MWDLGTGESIEGLNWNSELPSDQSCQVYTCQYEKNGGELIIAGGSGSNEVKVFDVGNNLTPCFQVKNLSRACYSVDFSNKGDMFAMGGGDGVIRVFNVSLQSFV